MGTVSQIEDGYAVRVRKAHDLFAALNRPAKDATWFTAKLFRLMLQSDVENLSKFYKGFPIEVALLREWRSGADAFWAKYEIDPAFLRKYER
jgi:hypothetical protein